MDFEITDATDKKYCFNLVNSNLAIITQKLLGNLEPGVYQERLDESKFVPGGIFISLLADQIQHDIKS